MHKLDCNLQHKICTTRYYTFTNHTKATMFQYIEKIIRKKKLNQTKLPTLLGVHRARRQFSLSSAH